MMNDLSSLTTNETVSDTEDVLGTNYLVDSGMYDFTIDMAYTDKSVNGAISINLVLKNAEASIKQTIYVSSGDAKGNKITYTTKDNKTKYLPGYNIFRAVTLLAVGVTPDTMKTENKVIKRYSKEANKVIPQSTNVLMDLLNKPITIGLFNITENKRQKVGKIYEATSETRTFNEIHSVFRTADKFTVNEVKNKAVTPVFYDKWKTKYSGKNINKVVKISNNTGNAITSDLFNTQAPSTDTTKTEDNTETTEASVKITDNELFG